MRLEPRRDFRLVSLMIIAAATLGLAVLAPRVASAQAAPLTLDQLRNATYPSAFTADGTASLADGAYAEPAAPGSASLVTVTFVDAAIADDFAAVVLVTGGGGSGSFYSLHLVSNDGGSPAIGAGTLLGDRVVLHEIAIVDGSVRVALTAHAETDPLCCPSVDETRVYGFTATGFSLLSTTPGLTLTTPAPAETGAAGLSTPAVTPAALIALLALAAVALVASARAVPRRRA